MAPMLLASLFLATVAPAAPVGEPVAAKASPIPVRTAVQASVRIVSGAAIHFDRYDERRAYPLREATIRDRDGTIRQARLVEFE